MTNFKLTVRYEICTRLLSGDHGQALLSHINIVRPSTSITKFVNVKVFLNEFLSALVFETQWQVDTFFMKIDTVNSNSNYLCVIDVDCNNKTLTVQDALIDKLKLHGNGNGRICHVSCFPESIIVYCTGLKTVASRVDLSQCIQHVVASNRLEYELSGILVEKQDTNFTYMYIPRKSLSVVDFNVIDYTILLYNVTLA